MLDNSITDLVVFSLISMHFTLSLYSIGSSYNKNFGNLFHT